MVQITIGPVYTVIMDTKSIIFFETLRKATLKIICIVILVLLAPSVLSQSLDATSVNIFGDGDPANGIEDSREKVLGGRRRGISLADQRMNAGTIKCDGKIRGTAMVIDTGEIAPNLNGVVLVSAAHVLFDLNSGKRFKRCEFHFLALGKLARYRVKINLEKMGMGNFDPLMATDGLQFGEQDWVFLYAPETWRGYNPDDALLLRVFSFSQMESYRQAGGELRLIAFDSSAGTISVSRDCTVIESVGSDLGGGGWAGQLLDDCDSGTGASGGGIVAVLDGKQYLIGIRSGSHWNEDDFPKEFYPNGPPDGSLWDLNSNTNFGRAIDARIMQVLQEFTGDLVKLEAGF